MSVLLREAIESAMGCLSPLSVRPDERLAWYRLNGALKGERPKPRLSDYENAKEEPPF